MAAPYPIRPISDGELPACYEVAEHAFNATVPPGAELERDREILEIGRTLAAVDGTEIAGTATAYSMQMTVPGGSVSAAGVAGVAVLPTYRRRGILTSLMRHQLADIRGRGEPVAALYPSEAVIYGRYGYAQAVTELSFTIRRGEGQVTIPGSGPAGQTGNPGLLRLRIADPKAAVPELAQVYAPVQAGRPGMLTRDSRWWNYAICDPEHRRGGGGPLRCVVAEDGRGPRGYVLYSAVPGDPGGPRGRMLATRELVAADPVAAATLWADLLTRDLAAGVRVQLQPADDPLPHLVADSGRTQPQLTRGLWVRLVSVPGAMAQRRYACAVDLVLDVADDLLADNAGRWRLRAPALGPATCERTAEPADIALPVTALASCYLGSPGIGARAAAGQVTELRPGALAQLAAAMSWQPAPWCPTKF